MDEPKSRDDPKLNEALLETFPASDAPANTPETGIRIGPVHARSDPSVTDNRQENRFELSSNGQTAFLAYERTNDTLTLIHTEVPPVLRGRRIGEALVDAALHVARSEGLRIVVVCPFARAYLRRHPPSK